MKLKINCLCLILLLLFFLSNCATTIHRARNNDELTADQCYIAGRFSADFHLIGGSRYSMYLKNIDNDESYYFEFTMNTKIQALPVDPGSYIITSFVYYHNDKGIILDEIVMPEKLLRPFELDYGEIIYIGDFYLPDPRGFIIKRATLEYDFDLEQAINDLEDKFYITDDINITTP